MELPITSLFIGLFALFLVFVRIRPATLPDSQRGHFAAATIPTATLLFLIMAILELHGLLWWIVTFLGLLTTFSYLPVAARFAPMTVSWALIIGGVICVYVWVIQVLLR